MMNLAKRGTKLAALGGLIAVLLIPFAVFAARTNISWVNLSGTTYIQPNFPSGMDLLIYGSNHYINFGTVTASSGYGIRDNGGTMEFKNSGGSWAGLGSGSGGSFPFSVVANFGTTTSATNTPLWLRGNQFALFASSTSVFDQSSTSLASFSSSVWLSSLTSSGLGVDSNGKVYAAATTTYSSGLTYANGNVTADLGNSVSLTTEVIGDLPFANLAQVSANSVLGNITGSTADAASIATTSLFAGNNGEVLARSGGTWIGVPTTTFSGGLTYSNGNVVADLGTAIVSGEITNDTIVNDDINSAAGIVYSKLTLTNSLLEADLKVVDSATDEDILTYESTTGDFEWHTCAEITGSSALCDGDDATGAGGGSFSYTTATNFGQIMNSTTTGMWFRGTPVSFAASSTAQFDQIKVGTTTSGNLSYSTFLGNTSFGSSTPATGAKAPLFVVGTSSNTYINIGADGKMGILGTNNNGGRLSFGEGSNVNVNANVFGLFQDVSDARFGASVNSSGIFMKSSGGVYAYDYTNAVPKVMNLQEFDGLNAKVGVGSSTPWAMLSIHGDAETGPQFVVGSSTKTDFIVHNNGRTGIATTTPGTLFSINGVANFVASAVSTIYNGLRVLVSLEIPNGTAPTVDAAGEIALDITSNNWIGATTTSGHVVIASATTSLYTFVFASTSPDFVSGGILEFPAHFLAQNAIGIICDADGGTSVVINLSDGTNDTNTVTCTTTETQFALTSNNIWTAYENIRMEVGTVTGAVDYLKVRVVGYRTTN